MVDKVRQYCLQPTGLSRSSIGKCYLPQDEAVSAANGMKIKKIGSILEWSLMSSCVFIFSA